MDLKSFSPILTRPLRLPRAFRIFPRFYPGLSQGILAAVMSLEYYVQYAKYKVKSGCSFCQTKPHMLYAPFAPFFFFCELPFQATPSFIPLHMANLTAREWN